MNLNGYAMHSMRVSQSRPWATSSGGVKTEATILAGCLSSPKMHYQQARSYHIDARAALFLSEIEKKRSHAMDKNICACKAYQIELKASTFISLDHLSQACSEEVMHKI